LLATIHSRQEEKSETNTTKADTIAQARGSAWKHVRRDQDDFDCVLVNDGYDEGLRLPQSGVVKLIKKIRSGKSATTFVGCQLQTIRRFLGSSLHH